MNAPARPSMAFVARVAILLAGTFGTAVLAFGTQLLLTRTMGLAEYGRIAALLAAVNVATPLASIGLGWFWLDLFGRYGRAAQAWIGPSIRLGFSAILACTTALGVYAFATDRANTEQALLVAALLAPVLAGQALSDSTSARLQLEERYFLLAGWQALTQLGRTLGAILVALWTPGGLVPLLAAYAIVGTLTCVASVRSLLQVSRGEISLVGHAESDQSGVHPVAKPGWSELFSHAAPYSFVTFFYLIYSQGIVAMVGALLGSSEAALYSVAFLVTAVMYLLPNVVYIKFLAGKLLRWWHHDRTMFDAVFHLGLLLHLAIGLVCAAATMLLAPFLMPLAFGDAYRASVPVLMILAIAIPIRFIQHSYGSLLFSKEHIRRKIAYMGCAAALSVILNLILMPLYGIRGAATAAVLSELLLLLLYMAGVSRHVQGIELRASFSAKTVRESLRRVLRGEG